MYATIGLRGCRGRGGRSNLPVISASHPCSCKNNEGGACREPAAHPDADQRQRRDIRRRDLPHRRRAGPGAHGRRLGHVDLLRASHPAVEASRRPDRPQGDERGPEADDGGHADLRHRGEGPGNDRLQPRRRGAHRPDPPRQGAGAARAGAPVPRGHRQHRLHVRARARRLQHAVRRDRIVHRQVPQPQGRRHPVAARLRQRVREDPRARRVDRHRAGRLALQGSRA